MTVKLLDHMGSDRSIVDAARESFDKKTKGIAISKFEKFQKKFLGRKEFPTLTAADKGLINFLMKNRHGTPFEVVQFYFHIECPIFEAREWFRHRIGSFNERSGRYVEFKPEFFLPKKLRKQVGKPGNYSYVDFQEGKAEEELLHRMEYAYKWCYKEYQDLMTLGVAKEQARMVLPAALMTGFVWSVNLRSLMNFIGLRTAPDAMKEIRDDAMEVEKLILPVVPIAMVAFNNNERVAP